MRILAYGLSSDKLGGIETFLLNMNHFMSADCVFDYVIEGTSTIHEESIEKKGGDIIYVAPKKKIISNMRDWHRMLRERKEKDRAVYFNIFSLSWFVPIIQSRLAGYPVIVHSHNNDLHDCGFVIKAMHEIGKFLLRFMRVKLLTNSPLSTEFMYGKNETAELVYNAIDTERFAFDEQRRRKIREEIGITESTKVIGFVGRFAFQKNPEFVVDIYNEIYRLDHNTILMMVGDGELMSPVKQKLCEYGLEDNVILLGNRFNIEDYYQAMDAFILPSRFEGLGLVLIEAQTAGLPSVTSAGVVPKEAQVTDLLDYISLEEQPEVWAKKVLSKIAMNKTDRAEYRKRVGQSSFDIVTESKRLEMIIKDYCASDCV